MHQKSHLIGLQLWIQLSAAFTDLANMRVEKKQFWKLTKYSKFCKQAGNRVKEDYCKADREARAAASSGYIDGRRVIIDK